jgi:anti-sigma-K factor RskA
MSEHDSNELDELLGAYALDALDEHERRRVDEYLAVNPRAAAEVAAHREVATMLAYTGTDAPAGLWERIASELDEPAPQPGPELAKVLPMNERDPTVVEAVVDQDGHGFLLASELPALPNDQTYQLWGIIGEQVISIGVLGPHPELETFTVKGDLAGLAVTIEPAGGVVSDGNPDGAFVGMFA